MISTLRTMNTAIRFLLLVALLGFTHCDTEDQSPSKESTLQTSVDRSRTEAPGGDVVSVHPSLLEQGRIRTTAVLPFAYAGAILVPGEVVPAPDGEAEVGSLVNGRVASVEVAEGTHVKSGQLLGAIDSPQVGAIRADLARAGAQLTAAQKRWERQLALQAQGATSQSAIEEAKANVLAAEADQQAARAQLRAMGTSDVGTHGKVALRSPIDGVVVERRATLGAAVASDSLLFRIIDLRKLRVRAHWSESLGPLPATGTSVDISPRTRTAATHEHACHGTIEAQLGLVNATTRSITLQISPDPKCFALAPGSYVEVVVGSRLDGNNPSNWTQIPSQAVVDLRGFSTVFVARPQAGEFEVRRVVPAPNIGLVTPIEMGLYVDERVVTAGTILLKGEALADLLGAD